MKGRYFFIMCPSHYPDSISIASEYIRGEILVEWVDTQCGIIPRIMLHKDSWALLHHIADVIKTLADLNNKSLTITQFAKLLEEHGFENRTPEGKY